MGKKADIKICRYINCKHHTKEIDTSAEPYKVEGNRFYHADCYAEKQKREWKDEETKKDLQYIKNRWVENISNTVVYSQLFEVLNHYVSRGVPSKYLAFVIDYVVEHKLNLKHPFGLKYFVDDDKIKNAYRKKVLAKRGISRPSDFKVEDIAETPTFKFANSPTGFGKILKGKTEQNGGDC